MLPAASGMQGVNTSCGVQPGMNMAKGVVNEDLIPVVPLSVRNDDNEWQDVNFMLDTGFDGDLALEAPLLDRYCLATRPHRQLLTPQEVLEKYDNWGRIAPYTSEVLWNRAPRETSLRLLEEPPQEAPFRGMLGTGLLLYHVVVLDAVEGGTVTVDNTSTRAERRGFRWRLGQRKHQRPSLENFEEYMRWFTRNVPWTNIPVQDSEGRWLSVWVKVDTGSNGELTLPTSWVDRLGLTLPETSTIRTPDGFKSVSQGQVWIKWQGKETLVDCQRRDDVPPLIGMELLKGNRIIIDFNCPRPAIEIRRLPKSTGSITGIRGSIASFFAVDRG